MAYRYIEWIWAAAGIAWLLGALRIKRAARREATASRMLHVAVMAAGFGLLFSSRLRVGPLAWRFLPDDGAIPWAGLALAAAGCAFALWARLLLGGNWSGSVTIKQGHTLVRRGPYTIVRHPIYTGFLFGLLGTALALGQLGGIVGLILALTGWYTKSRMEEAFMIEQFGDEYRRYQRDVKALVPFLL